MGLCLLTLLFVLSAGVSAQSVDKPLTDPLTGQVIADPDSLLIQIESGSDISEVEFSLNQLGMMLERNWPDFGLAQVSLGMENATVLAADVGSLQQATEAISGIPGIQMVAADLRIVAADRSGALDPAAAAEAFSLPQDGVAPNDPLYAEQWAYPRMDVPEAWGINQGSPALIIALIDSGYDVSHDDISEDSLWTNMIERNGLPNVDDDDNGFVDDYFGWDWIENDSTTNDPYGHGTHVGGTIAAATGNKLGVAGLGPNLEILPLRVLDGGGFGQISDLIDALYYAHKKRIRVANLSLVLQSDSPMLARAVEKANDAGMVIVAASGNRGVDSVSWPAKYPGAIAVAATDADDKHGLFSNSGPEIDVAAPGVDILSTYLNDGYTMLDGTSMATAHVSALAGLILSLRPDLSADQLTDLIRDSADDVNKESDPGFDDTLGFGRIDFLEALLLASEGLTIRPATDAESIIFSGEPAEVMVAVETESASVLPSQGTVVYYELFDTESNVAGSGAAGQPLFSGKSVTGLDGLAPIAFMAPAQLGEYQLRLTVGRSVKNIPLIVQGGASALQLTLDTEMAMVGAIDHSLSIKIRDAMSQPVTTTMPLHLETNLGQFQNGSQQYGVMVDNGAADILLDVGRVAAVATITASVGDLSVTEELIVLPALAASIKVVGEIKPLSPWFGANEALIRLTIADKYGNAVADGTTVRLRTEQGELSENDLVSLSGSVSSTLTVPAGVTDMVSVWVVVPGAEVHARVDIPVIGYAFWFPIIQANFISPIGEHE